MWKSNNTFSFLAVVLATTLFDVGAFLPSSTTTRTNKLSLGVEQHAILPFDSSRGRSSPRQSLGMEMFMSSNGNNQFDVSRPVFDPLALRSIRGDALIRYNALNQSEPLRITLYGLMAFIFLSAPLLGEAVGYNGGELSSAPARIVSVALSLASSGLFVRECTKRSRQLTRMEKELNTETLPIRLPTNAFSDKPWTDVATLKDLQRVSNPPRIIALSGTKERLQEALSGLTILGRRLKQASVYVVAVSTDGSTLTQWQETLPSSAFDNRKSLPWLADPYQPQVWLEYIESLTNDRNQNNDEAVKESTSTFRWFGLNSSGRSFGSGEGDIPQWRQIFGQFLAPTDILDESDASMSSDLSTDMRSLFDAHALFYKSLTTGDLSTMINVYTNSSAPQVSEVVEAGGRIDSWVDCLADGARPQDMLVSGTDGILMSDLEAFTTNVEFPAINAGVDSATLLAVQQWTRKDKQGEWKLQLHQTIPWSPDAKAQGTLRCDCRGCVALTRGPERRTFGGIIG